MSEETFREIILSDFEALMEVRLSVRENQLSDSTVITKQHLADFLQQNGKGWLCEIDSQLVGFCFLDGQNQSVWALFVRPEFEGRGIGRILHDMTVNWAFEQGFEAISLTTEASTRAERFYQHAGWQKSGVTFNGEVRFVLNKCDWIKN